MLVVVAHGETASLCRCQGGGDGDGGGDDGGSGGDGGGDDGGGRGGKITVACWTLSALASMPRLLASDEVMALELRVVAVVAAASEAEPCRVMLMVTAVDVAMGVATVTFCPSALANEPVSALCSWAASVAFALRLSAVPAGMAMTKVTSMPLCSRRPSGPSSCSSPCNNRRPEVEPIVTLQPAGCPLQTVLWTLVRCVVASVPAGSSRPNVDFFSTMTSALGSAPVDARRAVMTSAALLPSVASEVSATPTDAVKERGGNGGDDGGGEGGDGGGGDGGDAGGDGGGGVGEGEGGGGDRVDPGTPARQQVLRQMSLYRAGD